MPSDFYFTNYTAANDYPITLQTRSLSNKPRKYALGKHPSNPEKYPGESINHSTYNLDSSIIAVSLNSKDNTNRSENIDPRQGTIDVKIKDPNLYSTIYRDSYTDPTKPKLLASREVENEDNQESAQTDKTIKGDRFASFYTTTYRDHYLNPYSLK
jgi:hypothetical protein